MSEQRWWQSGVIYQVYPRSFQSMPGHGAAGIGNLRGVLSRLDYLVALGVDAVWLSPFYPSPMADFGYDVSDYTGVDPIFGTLEDFDALLAGAHARGLKLILDFVPNHTSDQHPWFLESRSSRTNPKRDWYLWHNPAPSGANAGGPQVPNNWLSNFGGVAWTYDEPTGQFFYHSFLPEQPDLNWRNPEVRAAMYAALRFWLGKGVDGFRMDVLWLLIKDDQFRSNPPNPDFHGDPTDSTFWALLPTHTADQPKTLEIVGEMRALLDSYPGDRVLIGEIYLPVPELVRYYGATHTAPGETPQLLGAQMPFNFHLIQTAWQAAAIASLIREYGDALPRGAWPNWVLGNHDQHRLASRVGPEQARVAAVLLLTLRGTPTLYMGDELGLPDAEIAPDEVQDPAEKRQPGIGQGRDPERAPTPWENTENAGFCAPGEKTWLPLVQDWPRYSVQSEGYDARSPLALYRRLLALRRQLPALHAGTLDQVEANNGVLSFVRAAAGTRLRVLLNLTDEPREAVCEAGRILLSSTLDAGSPPQAGRLGLRADEAVIVELASPGQVSAG